MCATTGLAVDLWGTAPATEKQEVMAVAVRADMDALKMPENNPDLEYKSTTDHAHMCGHDGHCATMLSLAQVFMK